MNERMEKASEKNDFENSLQMLQKIVKKLEGGDLPLEEALKAFEEGVKMSKECSQALSAAEQRVELLMSVSDEEVQTRPIKQKE